MKTTRIALALALTFLTTAAFSETVTRNDSSRILALGDSMLAWNRTSGSSVVDVVEASLGERIVDRSTVGASFNYILPVTGAMGMNITSQYRPGQWEWVIVNGGGNDLWLGCGCNACDRTLDKLISADGKSGKLPALFSKIRQSGAKIIFVGYLHSPGTPSIIDHCKNEDTEYQARIQALADRTADLFYVRASGIVGQGDRSYHGADMIHPSRKGSKAIARLIVEVIRKDAPLTN